MADDGEESPEQQQSHIFDPFFTTKQAGRELGLSTVTSILNPWAEESAWRVNPGRAAAFTFYLPL